MSAKLDYVVTVAYQLDIFGASNTRKSRGREVVTERLFDPQFGAKINVTYKPRKLREWWTPQPPKKTANESMKKKRTKSKKADMLEKNQDRYAHYTNVIAKKFKNKGR